jgi:hypothetical protein
LPPPPPNFFLAGYQSTPTSVTSPGIFIECLTLLPRSLSSFFPYGPFSALFFHHEQPLPLVSHRQGPGIFIECLTLSSFTHSPPPSSFPRIKKKFFLAYGLFGGFLGEKISDENFGEKLENFRCHPPPSFFWPGIKTTPASVDFFALVFFLDCTVLSSPPLAETFFSSSRIDQTCNTYGLFTPSKGTKAPLTERSRRHLASNSRWGRP